MIDGRPTRRVLHVITTIDRGGAENHLVTLVGDQLSRGMDVTIAYLKGVPYWAGQLRSLGVKLMPLEMGFYGNPLPVIDLIRALRSQHYDVLHAHLPPAELYARVALIFASRKIRFVVTRHNDAPFCRGPMSTRISAWVLRRASRIVAISHAVARRLREEAGPEFDRCGHVIYYGISDDWSKESNSRDITRHRLGIDANALVVCCVARLVPQKALHVLLEGFARAVERAQGTILALVLVGRGPLQQELEALAAKRGILPNVKFISFSEEIPEIMSASDIFALTSEYEGFGLVLVEAMACKLPVVATNISAIPEIVETGVSGVLIPLGDCDGFASAILELRSRELRERMGTAGYNLVRTRFSSQVMCQRFAVLYDGLLEASAAE